jgi:hypothetical protein
MMLVFILIVLAVMLIGAAVGVALIQQKPSELPGHLRERLRAFDQKDASTKNEDTPEEKKPSGKVCRRKKR